MMNENFLDNNWYSPQGLYYVHSTYANTVLI